MAPPATLAEPSVMLPETGAPLPYFRPDNSRAGAALDALTTGSVDRLATASLPVQLASAARIGPPVSGDLSTLKTALESLSRGDADAARAARDTLAANALDRLILEWAIATSGNPAVSGAEIGRALALLEGWPGLSPLRRATERALAEEQTRPEAVVAAFADEPPDTVDGVIVLARAHLALDDREAALAVLGPFWRTARIDQRSEMRILREFGATIPQADHRFRMERMLHADKLASAERVAGLAGASELAAAWTAVTRDAREADALLARVPEAQRGAGFIYAQAKRLRRTGHYRQAAEVLAEAPTEAAALVDPDSWWIERRVLSRELLDTGAIDLAYAVAAGHAAESPVHAADAEFHAGWYALRGLRDAKTASAHFERITTIADGPISLSRAYYWLARAAEESGDDATGFYEKAAAYGTAFYGQVAAARLGRKSISTLEPAPTVSDRAAFANRVAVRAIERLEEAGHPALADKLYRDLGSELTSPGELALLAGRAGRRGNHFLELRIGKAAAARGMDIGILTHPVGAIPGDADISGSGKALAYAIARQESEFNVAARSGAGALGLLQLLPGTARDMARKVGLTYSQGRLTSDAGYNATLGATFLAEQLDRFEGSYILTFIGYNAGPRRAREWVERYGDPRGMDIDGVIDWIERIPFTETRGYVQRVMENYQVYKMRLTGSADIVKDLTGGRD